jgi:hypothetical protein
VEIKRTEAVTRAPPPTDRPRPIPAGSNLPAIRQEARSNWVGWTGLGIAVAGIAVAVVFGQPRIVQLWPPAKPFYKFVGLLREPNVAVANVRASFKAGSSGATIAQIEIDVVNRGNAAGPVPALAVALLDGQNRSVASWTVAPDGAMLRPGEARLVRTEGNSAAGAQSVAVAPATN